MFLSYLQYTNHMLFKHQKLIQRKKSFIKQKEAAKAAATGAEVKPPVVKQEHLCNECGKAYSTPNAVKKHIEYMHTAKPSNCICNVCGKNFRNNHKLRMHMLLHEPPTIPCPFCDKMFETDHKVKKHIKSNHLDPDQMLYQCEFCKKGFSHFNSYESHMNDHKNIRPYQCQWCDKSYRNAFDY